MQLPDHGANPHHVYEKFGMKPPSSVLDFSENVNPAGLPETSPRNVGRSFCETSDLSRS